jgi:hypothetical protein
VISIASNRRRSTNAEGGRLESTPTRTWTRRGSRWPFVLDQRQSVPTARVETIAANDSLTQITNW